jgi:hypothetical protein
MLHALAHQWIQAESKQVATYKNPISNQKIKQNKASQRYQCLLEALNGTIETSGFTLSLLPKPGT